MSEVQGENVEVVSEVSTEQPDVVVEETPEEVVLPSDEVPFTMPEKFEGKSIEDIAKAYVELEKMKNEKTPTKEEDPKETPPTEETTEVDYNKYYDMYKVEGGLSDEAYAELEALGHSKESINEQIEFIEYKQAKQLEQVLEPLGGGKEKFEEVGAWARENLPLEDMQAFNKELEQAGPKARVALLKDLYSQYDNRDKQETVVHTNKPQTQPKQGYANQSDLLKDLADPRYKSDKNFAKAVEAKMALTDDSNW